MAQDYSDLIKYLNKEFSRIDGRLDGADKRFDSVEKRLEGIKCHLEVVDARLNNMDIQIDGLHKKFAAIQDSLDAYAKKADDYFQEMLMSSGQLDRHDKWIQQLAGQSGMKLST